MNETVPGFPNFEELMQWQVGDAEHGLCLAYQFKKGEWVVLDERKVELYRSPDNGIGTLVMTIPHQGTEESMRATICLALSYTEPKRKAT